MKPKNYIYLHLLLVKQRHNTHDGHPLQTYTKFFFPCFKMLRTYHFDKTAHAGPAIIISSEVHHELLSSVQIFTIISININFINNYSDKAKSRSYQNLISLSSSTSNHRFRTTKSIFKIPWSTFLCIR
jgi:hypothetical protein